MHTFDVCICGCVLCHALLMAEMGAQHVNVNFAGQRALALARAAGGGGLWRTCTCTRGGGG